MIAALLLTLAPAAAQTAPAPKAQAPVAAAPPAAPVAAPPAPRDTLGYLTASQLADKCNDPSPPSISYCYAYITGIHDAARAYEIWLNQREFCVPAAVSQADLRRSFLGYLLAYPDRRTGQAASVVVVALKDSYPCAGPVK